MTIARIMEYVSKDNRSAWNRGVIAYAQELLDNDYLTHEIEAGNVTAKNVEKYLLNGASSWNEYSWGGCALIYNEDIAERLCTPSELKKTRHGERRPNGHEEWLDIQASALKQACFRIRWAMRLLKNE